MDFENALNELRVIFPSHTEIELLKILEQNRCDVQASIDCLLAEKSDEQTAMELQDQIFAEQLQNDQSKNENDRENEKEKDLEKKLSDFGTNAKLKIKNVYRKLFSKNETETEFFLDTKEEFSVSNEKEALKK